MGTIRVPDFCLKPSLLRGVVGRKGLRGAKHEVDSKWRRSTGARGSEGVRGWQEAVKRVLSFRGGDRETLLALRSISKLFSLRVVFNLSVC